jgi:bacterioferritin (cytochrome b1)
VQLERVNPDPAIKISLIKRLEAAIEDANRIAERLHQLTGTMELQVDWLPSANTPVASDNWSFQDALLEGVRAETITLECYRRVINHLKPHDPPTASIMEEIVEVRQSQLNSEAA